MIFFFTGAGISADSGLSTFRDKGGLWSNFNPAEVADYQRLIKNYYQVAPKCFAFYNERKEAYAEAKPNDGHKVIAELVNAGKAKLVTTNIDMLHEAAGTKELIKVHGSISEMACLDCQHVWEEHGELKQTPCPKCGSKLVKPGVIFFGEQAPRYLDQYNLFRTIKPGDKVVVVGCSHMVCRPFADIELMCLKKKIEASFNDIELIDVNMKPNFAPGGKVQMYLGHADKVLRQLFEGDLG